MGFWGEEGAWPGLLIHACLTYLWQIRTWANKQFHHLTLPSKITVCVWLEGGERSSVNVLPCATGQHVLSSALFFSNELQTNFTNLNENSASICGMTLQRLEEKVTSSNLGVSACLTLVISYWLFRSRDNFRNGISSSHLALPLVADMNSIIGEHILQNTFVNRCEPKKQFIVKLNSTEKLLQPHVLCYLLWVLLTK